MTQKAIFVPGLLCTRELFNPQIDVLGARLDIAIGDHTKHDTLADTARDILSGAPERFVLAGLSMGGYISFEIMRQAPERVIALVLMDTTARPDTPEQTEFRESLIETSRSKGLDPVMETLLPKFLAESSRQKPHVVERVQRMANETGVDAFVSQQKMIMGRPDFRPGLGKIGCPMLVVAGKEDTLTPPDLAREIADAVPNAKLDIISGAGHLATIEAPDEVNAAIAVFLSHAGID